MENEQNKENKENKENTSREDFSVFYDKFSQRAAISTPKFSEVFGKNKWINNGLNNLYPQEIIRLYDDASSLHSTLIKLRTNLIAGNGWEEMTTPEGKAFIKNSYGNDDLNQIAYKCALDLQLQGGFYVNLICNNQFPKKIVRIEHVGYEKVRFNKPTPECPNTAFWVSADWSLDKKYKPEFIDGFNFLNTASTSLYFTKEYSPNTNFYALPYYRSGLIPIKTSFEVFNYHLKAIHNGLRPSMVIVIRNGQLKTKEEKEEINERIKREWVGGDEANKHIIVWATAGQEPTFTPIQLNQSDKQFIELYEMLTESILNAHQIPAEIAGVQVAGKLGNTVQISLSYKMLQNSLITPQQRIIEATFNKLARINGITEPLKLKIYNGYLDVPDVIPQTPPKDTDNSDNTEAITAQ